ncbi:hypothetical protein O0L34_g10615 [Tuta absoluta]|nr:hypothetical protein O0L34_g10615 [Tuta absoluta]
MYGFGSNDKLNKHNKTGSAAQAAGTTNSGGTASAGSPSVRGMTKPDGCLAGKPDQSAQSVDTPVAKQVTVTKVTELQAPDGAESSHARLIDQAWQVVESKKKHPKVPIRNLPRTKWPILSQGNRARSSEDEPKKRREPRQLQLAAQHNTVAYPKPRPAVRQLVALVVGPCQGKPGRGNNTVSPTLVPALLRW